MNEIWHAFDLFIAAVFAIVLAFVGSLTRLFHEHAHGNQLTWQRVLFALPGAVLMGVIGTATGQYLHDAWGLPELTGGALGGALGYLGPSTLETLARLIVSRYFQPKDKGDAEKDR